MRPADDSPDLLDPARLARITSRVEMAMASGDLPSPHRRGLVVLRVAVVAIVLGATGLAGWAANQPDPPAPVSTAGAGELPVADLAEQAAAQTRPPLDDAFAYVATVVQGPDGTRWTDERWIAADGTGRRQHTPLDSQGRAGLTDTVVELHPGSLRIGGLTPAEVLALNSEPLYILAEIQDRTGSQTDAASLITSLIELLAWPGVPAGTRANLFLALEDLGYEARPGAEPGTIDLTGTGPTATDSTTLTIDATTTLPVRSVTRDITGRVGERSTTFVAAHLTEAPG